MRIATGPIPSAPLHASTAASSVSTRVDGNQPAAPILTDVAPVLGHLASTGPTLALAELTTVRVINQPLSRPRRREPWREREHQDYIRRQQEAGDEHRRAHRAAQPTRAPPARDAARVEALGRS